MNIKQPVSFLEPKCAWLSQRPLLSLAALKSLHSPPRESEWDQGHPREHCEAFWKSLRSCRNLKRNLRFGAISGLPWDGTSWWEELLAPPSSGRSFSVSYADSASHDACNSSSGFGFWLTW